jgi:hypothetical protein
VFRSILYPLHGLRVQRKGNFVGCHTFTILLPHIDNLKRPTYK